MSTGVGFQDAFKVKVLRRLGSWSSSMSVDEVDKLLTWVARLIPEQRVRAHAESLRHALSSSDAAGELARGFFDLSPNVRRRITENLLINWGILGSARRYEVLREEGWLPPAFAVISPTMRCNLRCRGCYAFEYTRDGELTTGQFKDVVRQCKDLGMYFLTISGGEPFVREDLLEIFEQNDDVFFQVYTNGTMIDDRVADRLLELGNVAPAISVEGYGPETDMRRGPGTYDRVLAAMERLRERNLLFGISATVTRYNSDMVCDDRFMDFYIGRGTRFAWLFQYIPIGREPDVDLMSTPDQRVHLRRWLTETRKTKPIFIGDFWNDGVYTGGCMAGGRLYFHITSNGNVEPCVFCHFTVGNVLTRGLKDILANDFFKALRYEQPYSEDGNLYTPCAIIDNPSLLRDLIRKYGIGPSHAGAESLVEDPRIVEHLDRYAARMRELTDDEWKRDHYANPSSEWHRTLGWRQREQWAAEREYLERWHREREMPSGHRSEQRKEHAAASRQ
ncbi:MAG: radical SAM protein [Candidatus Eisenbacteria bacterium]|nr:radical SAM protein [Candidatus Eisenbacteria bacterium]